MIVRTRTKCKPVADSPDHSYSVPMPSKEELIRQLAGTRKAILHEALAVPADLVSRRPTNEEWSVLEVVAHLIDVDHHWLTQAASMRDHPDYLFVPFDDARWKAEHHDILTRPFDQVLKDVEQSHREVLSVLLKMTEEELDREGRHPRGIHYTVRDVLQRYPPHDENHLAQIRSIRQSIQALDAAKAEPKRLRAGARGGEW